MKINLIIKEQVCKRCGKKVRYLVVIEIFANGYFIKPDEYEVPYLMKCEKCGSYGYFFADDPFFVQLIDKLSKKYGSPYRASTNTTPWKNKFFQLFEKIVDKCL